MSPPRVSAPRGRAPSRPALLAGAALLALLTAGCGQKGPLYLPKKTKTVITAPAEPAAATPDGAAAPDAAAAPEDGRASGAATPSGTTAPAPAAPAPPTAP